MILSHTRTHIHTTRANIRCNHFEQLKASGKRRHEVIHTRMRKGRPIRKTSMQVYTAAES